MQPRAPALHSVFFLTKDKNSVAIYHLPRKHPIEQFRPALHALRCTLCIPCRTVAMRNHRAHCNNLVPGLSFVHSGPLGPLRDAWCKPVITQAVGISTTSCQQVLTVRYIRRATVQPIHALRELQEAHARAGRTLLHHSLHCMQSLATLMRCAASMRCCVDTMKMYYLIIAQNM